MLETSDYTPYVEAGLLDVLTGGDMARRELAESAALHEIEAYLAPVYDLSAYAAIQPGGSLFPTSLTRVWVDLTLYHLYARLEPAEVPPLRRERRTEALAWLKQAAEGSLDPQLPRRTDTATYPPIPTGSNPKLAHR